ncbi:MAG: hypothetical protein O2866_03870 [archaeon]|nr:hypothetical protein [archaeon]MDA0842455.1 hypothetical protein [archaeon]MDA1168000.1 hypothetical protein [archaeon]
MKKSALFMVLLFVFLLIPTQNSVLAQGENDMLICCDASTVDLYLIGSQSIKKLTPFVQELGDEEQTTSISTTIASQESIGIWTLDNVWAGTVPDSTWSFGINYELSEAGGAQINATATVRIGSKSFSAALSPGNSFLSQGEGVLNFDIEVDSFLVSASNTIEVELAAQTIVFQVPTSDSELVFKWGTEEYDSSLEVTIPLVDIRLIEPEIEGKDVYIPISIESPYGMSTLALTESLSLYVNGAVVSGDPIETGSGDLIRVTWTWTQASGGTETINVEIRLVFQQGRPAMQGSTSVEVTTTDTGGGTGTYYPPDEPLRTNGVGSRLNVDIQTEISSDSNGIVMEKSTELTIYDEMAFWVRWGLDHIGDDNPAHSSALRAFNSGGVTEDDRVSRFIEPVEVGEFERQLVNLGTMYITQGLGLDSKELIGDFKDFDAIDISLDLHGEVAVKPHPVTLTFSTVEHVQDQERLDFIRDFVVVQPAKIWSEFDLQIEITTSMMTGLTSTKLSQSDAFDLQTIRTPFYDTIILKGDGIEQDESFTLSAIPTTSLGYSPFVLGLALLVSFVGAFYIALKISAYRRKKVLMAELVLMPLSLLVYIFAYPPLFIGVSVALIVLIWWLTAIFSPRDPSLIQAAVTFPKIPCPACQTLNAVTTDQRPHRFACSGCQKTIKLVA